VGDLRLKRTRRLTALTASRLGYAAGCLMTAVGVGIEFGIGWGLTVCGVVAAASCLLLVEVSEKGGPMAGDGS
jgi:hypothetical protein